MTIRLGDENSDKLGLRASPNALRLNQERRDLVKSARQTLDKMEGDMSATELRKAEQEHDRLMSRIDEIDEQLQREESLAIRESMRPIPGDGIARGVDDGLAELTDSEPSEAFALRSNQSFASHIIEKRAGKVEFGDLSTGAYLRAMVTGPKTDSEKRALAEGTDSAGGYTVPDILSARLIDRLRSASVVFRAGAQTVPLQSDVSYVAKVATDPVPAWRSENAAVNESDPTFARVTFTARSLAVLVKVSRELLEDSLNMETALPDLLSVALAQELDRVALLGTGTAPEPRGVANFASLTSSGVTGAELKGYAPLIKARTALRTANSDATAFIMSPRDEGQLAGLTATDGQPISLPPALANTPMLTTSKIPVDLGTDTDESVILAGDWRRLMIGMRSVIRVEILRERYADNLQYGFVAHLRADVAAEHEAAFTKLAGITLPVEEVA